MKFVPNICITIFFISLASPHAVAQLEARTDDGRIFTLHPDGTYTEKAEGQAQSYIPTDFIELHLDAEEKVGLQVEVKGEILFLSKELISISPPGRHSPTLVGQESDQITRETQVFLRNECVEFPGCSGTVRGEVVESYIGTQLAIHKILR